MAQQAYNYPDSLVRLPNSQSPTSPAASSSKNQFMESFKESNYSTILSGRSLDPVNFQFSEQKPISIQLQKLSQMNREKFIEVEAELAEAHRQSSVFRACRRLLDLNVIPEDAETILEIIHCRDSDSVEKYTLQKKIETGAEVFDWLPRLKYMRKAIAGAKYLERSIDWKELGSVCHTLELALYYRCWSQKGLRSRAYLPDGSRKNPSDTMDLEYLKAVYSQLLRSIETVTSKLSEESSEIYGVIGAKRLEVMGLRKEELRCTAASRFAETLSILSGPFDFCGLPREIRNKVYNQLLTFSYNITTTNMRMVSSLVALPDWDGPLYHRHRSQIRLWSHPLFKTSLAIRTEAFEEFGRLNCFAARSIYTLSSDLGLKFAGALFLSNLRDLSITWTSLGNESVAAVQALKSLTGLNTLTIYLNWDQLHNRCRNNLTGVAIFSSLIDLPRYILPSLENFNVFEVKLSRAEISENAELQEFDYGPWMEKADAGTRCRPNRLRDTAEKRLAETLSHRILNAKCPDTVYANGRKPAKPSASWQKSDEKDARKALRKNVQYVPVAAKLSNRLLRENLKHIISKVKATRQGYKEFSIGIDTPKNTRTSRYMHQFISLVVAGDGGSGNQGFEDEMEGEDFSFGLDSLFQT